MSVNDYLVPISMEKSFPDYLAHCLLKGVNFHITFRSVSLYTFIHIYTIDFLIIELLSIVWYNC